jgi:chemotaxis signal transduction protein
VSAGLQTAPELRRLFDASFAEARRPATGASEDLVAVRVGGDPYALRLGEIAGLLVDRRVVAVPAAPGATGGLRGVVAVRGNLAPVYGLRALLGYPEGRAGRWLVLVGAPRPIALELELFESFLRVATAELTSSSAASRPFVRQALRQDGLVRPLVHVPSLVEAIVRRSLDRSAPAER